MKETSKTQTEQILEYLQKGNSITPLEALNLFGCLRLGARIWDIKNKLGIPVNSKMVKLGNGKSVAEYSLAEQNKE